MTTTIGWTEDQAMDIARAITRGLIEDYLDDSPEDYDDRTVARSHLLREGGCEICTAAREIAEDSEQVIDQVLDCPTVSQVRSALERLITELPGTDWRVHSDEELEYEDVLFVTKGIHQGKIAYYDNDVDDGVIVLILCDGTEAIVSRRNVRHATEEERDTWSHFSEHALSKWLGVQHESQ